MAQNTPFPLGVFVGGPNGSDQAVQNEVTARYNSFVDLMGAKPIFMDAFVNQSKSIDNWGSDTSWTAWSWAQSPAVKGTIPVIGLPMATEGDRGNPGAVFRDFASGRYDNALRSMVKAWTDQGFHDLYVRPGWEMNVSGMPWYVGDNPQTQSEYVAAFKHIADVLHYSTPDANVKVIWNPNVQSWNGDLDVKSLYPGDQYVDQIGGDIYSDVYPYDLYDWSKNDGSYNSSLEEWASKPANLKHYYDYPNANRWNPTGDGKGNPFNMNDLIDFAKAHGKPVAIPETGSGGAGDHGPADNATFPLWLAEKLANSGANVGMVNIWNVLAHDNDWRFSGEGSSRPNEAVAWAQAFGSGAGANTTSGLIQSNDDAQSHTIVLNLSEDMFKGDASFAATLDGKSLGAAQDVTAYRSEGDTQSFTFNADLAAGQHDLGISFLNDAWEGTPETDRNLFVNGIQVDGKDLGTGTIPFHSAETKHVQFYT